MVECLTQDRGAPGSSLTGDTALWSLSKLGPLIRETISFLRQHFFPFMRAAPYGMWTQYLNINVIALEYVHLSVYTYLMGAVSLVITVKPVLTGYSKRPKIGFQDQLSLYAGQKYCRMLQGEHSAILSTFIKLPFAINTFILSIYQLPLKTGFTVSEVYSLRCTIFTQNILTQ